MSKEKTCKKVKKLKKLFSWEIKSDARGDFFKYILLFVFIIAEYVLFSLENYLGGGALGLLIILYIYFILKSHPVVKISFYKTGFKHNATFYPLNEILFFKEIKIKGKTFVWFLLNSRFVKSVHFEIPEKYKDKILRLLKNNIPEILEPFNILRFYWESLW